jgi:hypothetical protein
VTNDYEFFPTPDPFARYLVRILSTRGIRLDNCDICEPCVGAGDLVDAIDAVTESVYWSTNDLDPRWAADTHLDAARDDRAFEVRGQQPHWTITNPPFSVALEIANNAIQKSVIGVALYHRCTLMEPLKTPGLGRSFFREHPPTITLWMPRFAHQRSKATSKWSTDSATCVWSVWVKGLSPIGNVWPDEQLMDKIAAYTPEYRARVDLLMAAEKDA